MQTRYWRYNKKLALFCHKTEEDTPGAVWYEESMCQGGGKWQLQTDRLNGHIESVFLDKKYDPRFGIGVQGDEFVDVLMTDVKAGTSKWPAKDYSYLAKRVGNFDLERPLELKAVKFPGKNPDGTLSGYEVYLAMPYQGGKDPVPEFFTRDKQPKIGFAMDGNNKTWLTQPLFDALEQQVEAFNFANKDKLDQTKGSRGPTENEKAHAPNPFLEDCPL